MIANQPERSIPTVVTSNSTKFPKWVIVAALIVTLVLASLIALILSPEPVAPTKQGSMDSVDPVQVSALEAKWGIHLANVAVTANGGLIDLRFQVIDPDKAVGIHDPGNFPVLIDEATGKILDKPGGFHGGDHNAPEYKAGLTYYLLYQNNGSLLKRGSHITISFGDVKVENVIVR